MFLELQVCLELVVFLVLLVSVDMSELWVLQVIVVIMVCLVSQVL